MLARIPWLPILGYGTFFVLTFVLFTYWTFPYERAAAFYTQKLTASRGYRISIGEVSPYWLTGVEVEDTHIYRDPTDEVGVHIIRGYARASLFTVLGDAQDVSFDIDLATGSFEGAYHRGEESIEVDADLQAVRLEMFPMLAEWTGGLPLSGAATGKVDLVLHDQPDQSQGLVDLLVKNLRIGDGEAKLEAPGVPALTVDPIEAGDLKLNVRVDGGKATLEQLEAQGDDLELSGVGEVQLGKSLGTSRANLSLTARFTDAYKTKTPRTEAMFALLEGSNSRQLERATGPDGAYGFQITGSLASPRFIPGARAAAGPAGSPLRGRARRAR